MWDMDTPGGIRTVTIGALLPHAGITGSPRAHCDTCLELHPGYFTPIGVRGAWVEQKMV